MYERAISEEGDAMELSGVMLHARVLIFCLFFMGVRKNIFVFPEYIVTLSARSDATFHIRGQISLVGRLGPMGNFLG